MIEPQEPEKTELDPDQLAILEREIQERLIAGRMHSPGWHWNEPPEEFDPYKFEHLLPLEYQRINQSEKPETLANLRYGEGHIPPNNQGNYDIRVTDDPEGAA